MGIRFAFAAAIGFGLCAGPREAFAFDRFECLSQLLPVTDRGVFQPKRKGFEQPFPAGNGKYLIFPEVGDGMVTGFYIYDRGHAAYYDMVERDGGAVKLTELRTEGKVFDLVAQPDGLETVSIHFLPGYDPNDTDKNGPVMLGASILPVAGAFVSRPKQRKITYYDPSATRESEVKAWLHRHAGSRAPASVADMPIRHEILHLTTRAVKAEGALWRPLDLELRLRRDWVKTRNLDDESFRALNRALQGGCRDGSTD